MWCICTFLNHFRKASEQLLYAVITMRPVSIELTVLLFILTLVKHDGDYVAWLIYFSFNRFNLDYEMKPSH